MIILARKCEHYRVYLPSYCLTSECIHIMTTITDFDEINAEFIDARTGIRAAECHGFISGYYCASHNLKLESLFEHLISDVDDAAAMEQCHKIIASMSLTIIKTMGSDELTFQPLLPDDNASVTDRALALSEWSAGFVSGLGIGGAIKLNDDCDEFVKDLVSMSKMETVASDDEEGESALFELVEYIRVGVQMVYLETVNQQETKPEVLH